MSSCSASWYIFSVITCTPSTAEMHTAATYIVGPVTGTAIGASSDVIALSIAAGLVKSMLVMTGTPFVAKAIGLTAEQRPAAQPGHDIFAKRDPRRYEALPPFDVVRRRHPFADELQHIVTS